MYLMVLLCVVYALVRSLVVAVARWLMDDSFRIFMTICAVTATIMTIISVLIGYPVGLPLWGIWFVSFLMVFVTTLLGCGIVMVVGLSIVHIQEKWIPVIKQAWSEQWAACSKKFGSDR